MSQWTFFKHVDEAAIKSRPTLHALISLKKSEVEKNRIIIFYRTLYPVYGLIFCNCRLISRSKSISMNLGYAFACLYSYGFVLGRPLSLAGHTGATAPIQERFCQKLRQR